MEASGAGLAGGGDGAAQGQGEGGAQDGQQQGALTGDAAIAQLAEQMTSVQSGQEELRDFLSGIAQQQQGAGEEQQQHQEEQQPAPDLSFLENSDPQKAAEGLQKFMRAEAGTETQRLLQETLAPIQEQVSDMRRSQETDALVGEFPDLGDPQVAEKVVATARQYATDVLGQPELGHSVPFIRVMYMAGRAAELAQKQNGAADGAAATLEGAGGASPGGAAQGANTTESIAEKWGQRSNVLAKL